MRKLLMLSGMLALLIVTGCASVSVQTDFDQDADFSAYHTYRWMPPREGRADRSPFDNDLNRKRIHEAVDRELAAKGYTIAETEEPDILITYHIGLHDRVEVATYGYGTWRRPYHREVYHYKESTLILDMVDRELKQLVWRGAGKGVIGRFDDIDKRINDAVVAVLKDFPPQEK